MKLIKRRKPLVEEPLLPTTKIIRKKYRSGTMFGKMARHVSEHKNIKRYFAANLSALIIAGTFLPVAQNGVQAADFETETTETVIQTQNTLKTTKATGNPLEATKINQGFGLFHPGIDFGGEIGDVIKSIKSGTVVEVEHTKYGYGNTVVVDHGKGLTSRYAHLSNINVKVGDVVTTDTELGQVGITGRSTGPHLHLEIRQNGMALNPLSVLSR